MQTLKMIVGIVCWIFALFFFLSAILGFGFSQPASVVYAVPAFLFAIVGWVLVPKGRRRIPVAVATAIFGAYTIVIVIPNLVAMGYASSQNACVNNLRQLQAAKAEWALENGETNGAIVTVEDITPYIQLDRNGNIPRCPAGGTYMLGRVGEDVRCSIGTSDWPNSHNLSDTNDFTWEENFKQAYSILLGFRHVKTRD